MPIATQVLLNRGEVLLAEEWAQAVLGTNLEDRANYTGLSQADRYTTGYLGELAVAKMFDQFGIAYRHRVQTNGQSADSEFLVSAGDRRCGLEVKTASQPRYRRLMFPAAQHDHTAAFVVAARIEARGPFGVRVAAMGWLDQEAAARMPIGLFGLSGVPTMSRPYDELRPIGELLEVLTPVRVTR